MRRMSDRRGAIPWRGLALLEHRFAQRARVPATHALQRCRHLPWRRSSGTHLVEGRKVVEAVGPTDDQAHRAGAGSRKRILAASRWAVAASREDVREYTSRMY
jgi:hypothetical protein